MNSKSSRHALVFLADFSLVEHAKQLISSAYFKGGWNGDYVMLAINISESDLRWFRDSGVYVFRCPDLAQHLKLSKIQVDISLNRIWMFSECFKRWEHLITSI